MPNPVLPTPHDPRHGGYIERLLRGYGYLFRGCGFVLRHPALLRFVWLPILLALVLFAGVAYVVTAYYGEVVNWIWAKPGSWLVVFWYLFSALTTLVALLAGYVIFFVLLGLLTAPFNDALSERVEQMAYGREAAPFSWSTLMAGLGRALGHELFKLGWWLSSMIPLLVISLFVPGIGAAIAAVGGFVITARFLAYEHMDYCMGRREWAFSKKRRALKENRSLTTGFGISVASVLLLPIIGLLLVPMAAVGGTLLFCDLERCGAFAEMTIDPATGTTPSAVGPRGGTPPAPGA